MIAKIKSYALNGLTGVPVEVEVDSSNGLPAFDLVGLADTAVKESRDRVRAAIKNSGRSVPSRRITANFAPADVKKEGSAFDLPLAIGVLAATGQLLSDGDGAVLLGELSLDGGLRRINGVLPILISAKERGYDKFIIPYDNRAEASYVSGTQVFAAKTLKEVIDHLSGLNPLVKLESRDYAAANGGTVYDADMSLVKGQKVAKRALEIAVSGGHNVMFVGAPGTGKSMLAKCIPTIMPDMTFEEALETTKIHSVAGVLSDTEGIVTRRPFRSPHHTATTASLTGGGSHIKPGEISLAHNGVLFLDEMPEYSRATLESLRQPLEDGYITVSRASGAVRYPANFILCGSMNPCPCGNYGSESKPCTCSPSQIARYKSKISGPLMDRIDIQVQVDEVKYAELSSDEKSETSATVRERVNRTREIQRKRFENDCVKTNADMGERQIAKYCVLSADCENILKAAYDNLHLSPRARSRIIKVARTIADMSLSVDVKPEHLLEAISYRH
ncbi:MAG: YifB family Mg chelatase-like AAA ATPase [Candidatus Borkfalkiaceae bacterium]|nr:YifB family Mg chelatase-like AAA ATPase [Christensenellaceae bacterium]